MLREKAFAKVNLHLQITDVREDGYHNLQTVFVRISLHDNIYIEAKREPVVELSIDGPYTVPTGPKNIVYKAARWYLKRYGIKNWGVKIAIEKRMPPGSGLGSGSSDAGAVIRGLIRFFGEKDDKLLEDIAEIGADVPFFVSNYSVAVAEGVGEKLFPIEVDLKGREVWVFIPDFSLSTKEIYEEFDKMQDEVLKEKPLLDRGKILEVVKTADFSLYSQHFFNHLEYPAFRRCPGLSDLKRLLVGNSTFAQMTGSGSGFFALGFKEETEVDVPFKYKATFC